MRVLNCVNRPLRAITCTIHKQHNRHVQQLIVKLTDVGSTTGIMTKKKGREKASTSKTKEVRRCLALMPASQAQQQQVKAMQQ